MTEGQAQRRAWTKVIGRGKQVFTGGSIKLRQKPLYQGKIRNSRLICRPESVNFGPGDTHIVFQIFRQLQKS